jgi:uncharacterized protein (TIGR00369 family)
MTGDDTSKGEGPAADLAETNAYRSPFHDLLGFRMREWREGFVRVDCAVAPQLANRQGGVHGGVVLSLLDEVGAASGNFSADPAARPQSVTVEIAAKLVGPVTGATITATARVVGGGRTLYFVQSEARNTDGSLIAYASSTHRRRGG